MTAASGSEPDSGLPGLSPQQLTQTRARPLRLRATPALYLADTDCLDAIIARTGEAAQLRRERDGRGQPMPPGLAQPPAGRDITPAGVARPRAAGDVSGRSRPHGHHHPKTRTPRRENPENSGMSVNTQAPRALAGRARQHTRELVPHPPAAGQAAWALISR